MLVSAYHHALVHRRGSSLLYAVIALVWPGPWAQPSVPCGMPLPVQEEEGSLHLYH